MQPVDWIMFEEAIHPFKNVRHYKRYSKFPIKHRHPQKRGLVICVCSFFAKCQSEYDSFVKDISCLLYSMCMNVCICCDDENGDDYFCHLSKTSEYCKSKLMFTMTLFRSSSMYMSTSVELLRSSIVIHPFIHTHICLVDGFLC